MNQHLLQGSPALLSSPASHCYCRTKSHINQYHFRGDDFGIKPKLTTANLASTGPTGSPAAEQVDTRHWEASFLSISGKKKKYSLLALVFTGKGCFRVEKLSPRKF